LDSIRPPDNWCPAALSLKRNGSCATSLEAAGASLGTVVKTTVFMTDLGAFKVMNDIYATHFPGQPPARSTIQVAALPRGACVEIEAFAVKV
jgi:2-iminobutanoate/2-iminopropanoate deaminase